MFGARKTFKEDPNIWRRKLLPQTRTNTLQISALMAAFGRKQPLGAIDLLSGRFCEKQTLREWG